MLDKIKQPYNLYVKGIYEELIQPNNKWILNIKKELDTLGLNYI